MLNLYGCLCAIPLGLHSSTELNQLGPEVIERNFVGYTWPPQPVCPGLSYQAQYDFLTNIRSRPQ